MNIDNNNNNNNNATFLDKVKSFDSIDNFHPNSPRDKICSTCHQMKYECKGHNQFNQMSQSDSFDQPSESK